MSESLTDDELELALRASAKGDPDAQCLLDQFRTSAP